MTDSTSSSDGGTSSTPAVSFKNAAAGGIVVALVIGGVVVTVGQAGAGEAQRLLEAALPTTRFLCSAVMTASATTLALMVTLLSLSTGDGRSLKSRHFQRIRQIALVDVIAFVGATVLLAAHVFPFGESNEIPSGWYVAAYYTLTGLAALLGGLLVSVMIMLYDAVCDIIAVYDPGREKDGLTAEQTEER